MQIHDLTDDDGGPVLVAECAEPTRDWSAYVDRGLGYADAEDELRIRSRRHTDNVAPGIVLG